MTDAAERAELLRRLPLCAIVALAVRAAKRERAQFDLPGDAPYRAAHMADVDRALRMAMDFASGGALPAEAYAVVGAALDAARATATGAMSMAARHAAFAAAAAVAAVEDPDSVPEKVAFCARFRGAGGAGARADYERLLALSLGKFPELGDPVDASENGPLGPLRLENDLTP
jgi:hypothetical protein